VTAITRALLIQLPRAVATAELQIICWTALLARVVGVGDEGVVVPELVVAAAFSHPAEIAFGLLHHADIGIVGADVEAYV
jgi:hypothetical protein